MGMGIVSESEFESERGKLIPVVQPREDSSSDAEIIDMNRGRGKGNVEVPDSLRKVIGETSKIDGRAEGLELAKQFGLSPSSVSAYANGSNSTATFNQQPNLSHINEAKERISRRARMKLMQALKNITPDKLVGAKATDCSAIARDMSAIVKNMEPDTPKGAAPDNAPKFIFYAPQFRDERSFDIVNTKE